MKLAARIIPMLMILAGCATAELPVLTDAELPSPEPFQGANVIIAEVEGSPQEIRERVVQSLRVEGFDITQNTLGDPTIETEPRTFGSSSPGSARYHLQIPDSDDGNVLIRGRMITETVSDRNSFLQFPSAPVQPGGQRLSLGWNAWMLMNDVANVISTGELMYDRQ